MKTGLGSMKSAVSAPLGCGSKCSVNILGASVPLAIEACTPNAPAASSISFNDCALPGPVEFQKTATRESLGTISLRSSSRFPLSSGASVDNPVMLPPGRARLATSPLPTGSPALRHNDGNRAGCVLGSTGCCRTTAVTMMSTLRRTSSAASVRERDRFSLRISVLNDNVFPLHVPKLAQTLPECLDAGRE